MMLLLAIPLILASIWGVHKEGVKVLWVAVPIGLYLVYEITKRKPGAQRAELEKFSDFEIFDTDVEGAGDKPVKPTTSHRRKLRMVPSAPATMMPVFEDLGGGEPVATYELHKGLAYLVVVEADAYHLSDYAVVLMQLDVAAPTFTVRPQASGEVVGNAVAFKKDTEFTSHFLVVGAEAKQVRGFLIEPLRDALFDLPNAWVVARRNHLAVARFGTFQAGDTRELLELADVFFAEYGAGGAPSLLEPEGTAKKKKKKKPVAAPASPEEAEASGA